MLLQYDTELFLPIPENKEGMYLYEPKTLQERIKDYNDTFLRLKEHRANEPSRKHDAESKFKYMIWISITHNIIDELKEIAEDINRKQEEMKAYLEKIKGKKIEIRDKYVSPYGLVVVLDDSIRIPIGEKFTDGKSTYTVKFDLLKNTPEQTTVEYAVTEEPIAGSE